MSNKNQDRDLIKINSIKFPKSNSEANHKNKKIYRESKHYIDPKKNKIPLEKMNQNNHNSKQKQKSIINLKCHVSSNNSPFCTICGSINYINKESNKIIESIKPHNYFYSPEFSITSLLKNLSNKTNFEYQEIFSEFKDKKLNSNIISIRNKIIRKFIEYSKKILINKNTIYLSIILMDIIILRNNIKTKKKIEQIILGTYFLAVKFLDFAVNSFSIKEYQFTNEFAVLYSPEQIRKFEVNCLANIQYNLSITIFTNVLQIFLANGILLKNDIKMANSEQSMKNIYFLINKISENLICEDMGYIQYNQFKMACAILYLSRNMSKLEPWPKIFNELYNITFEDFSEEFNYVNNFSENNILISNYGNKKRERNSTCKNINMKRISFNSTYNNNRFKNQNGISSYKENNFLNGNNTYLRNNYRCNDKNNSCYFYVNNNNINSSLVCDTITNFINYFTNNDSYKKKQNHSGGKINSRKRSYDNNSKESIGDKKYNLLNLSSKYIRTHYKLIKNSRQLAFNQSLEMPRKTFIFQKRIYHTRSKKADNENKINSNRSQRIEKNIYNFNIRLLNEYNIENDKIKNNSLNKKNSEKKNNFKKILNNSEIQIKKKNNSQTNLLSFNIKKYPSNKLIADNPKKNSISNYSNRKNEKNNHNINNSNHKDNKNYKKNINYYSNAKKKNKENQKKYLYYNNNSSIKKEYKEYDASKEHKEISANLSFITITDSYFNSQKKNFNKNNIKIIDNSMKINNNKNIDSYNSKKYCTKKRFTHIKNNSCINKKVTNINLYLEKSFNKKVCLKKDVNTSHKSKKSKDKNNNHGSSNYNTNIILNKKSRKTIEQNNNIIIKINLINKKFEHINRNNILQKKNRKSNEGIGIIKKIKINNNNIRRKETSKRKRMDNNVSSYHYKNNNSNNNNSSLAIPNNKSNGNVNGKNNSDGYKHKNSKNYIIKNNRYINIDKKGRNFSMINQKKLKSSNSLL